MDFWTVSHFGISASFPPELGTWWIELSPHRVWWCKQCRIQTHGAGRSGWKYLHLDMQRWASRGISTVLLPPGLRSRSLKGSVSSSFTVNEFTADNEMSSTFFVFKDFFIVPCELSGGPISPSPMPGCPGLVAGCPNDASSYTTALILSTALSVSCRTHPATNPAHSDLTRTGVLGYSCSNFVCRITGLRYQLCQGQIIYLW